MVVRRYDEWQVEIILPRADADELERIKKLITTPGTVELRIVANRNHPSHAYVIALAEAQSKAPDRQRSKYVKDGETIVGYWARVDRVDPAREAVAPGIGALRVQVAGELIRDGRTGELVQLPSEFRAFEEHALERYLMEHGIEEIDVLVIVDKDIDVTGSHFGMVSRGYDETMRPCIRFNMQGEGARRMAMVTGSNLPDAQTDSYQRLAILLDGRVLCAPRIMNTISDRGQITGNFTQEEVDFIVRLLQAGRLPVRLKDTPVSETAIFPSQTAHQKTGLIVGIAFGLLVVIWLVLLLRYSLMGLGGTLASLLQLLIMLAAIELLHVVVTMPLVFASTAILLLAVVGKLLICESVRRRMRDEESGRSSIWRSFGLSAIPFVIVLAALWFAGVVVYVVGTFPLRSAAVPVVIGSTAALATSCFCLLLPVAVIATERQDRGRGDPSDASFT
ncbi:MAG TPA: hypothetical protein EYP14_19535 [Planctomycetaceae bacterium]|nr:hypothetical protein [Planctomycetaceae bacterium]